MVVLSGCGYSARENELIGQVKKVVRQTPLICSDRTDVDVSLGVFRNGIGSASKEDVWLTVPNQEDVNTLKSAAESGQPVKVLYDTARVAYCGKNNIVSKVELAK